jgi:hypothetical protein
MSAKLPVHLRPTRADLAVARASARAATPPIERTLRIVTWLADEKVVLAGAATFWLVCSTRARSAPRPTACSRAC